MVDTLSNMENGGLIVAVDGPSGTGKSTMCRALAKRLDAKYVDTGAMYRVATLAVLRAGVDPADTAKVIEATADLPLEVSDDPDSTEVLFAGEDVKAEIRGAEVTKHVSAVSAIPEVRVKLVELQRKLAREAGRAIVEGRDIGTVVLPAADVKFFLTASEEERARRRYEQRQAFGESVDLEKIKADIHARDERDKNREVAPLKQASDAILVDSTDMSEDEVLDTMESYVENDHVL